MPWAGREITAADTILTKKEEKEEEGARANTALGQLRALCLAAGAAALHGGLPSLSKLVARAGAGNGGLLQPPSL